MSEKVFSVVDDWSIYGHGLTLRSAVRLARALRDGDEFFEGPIRVRTRDDEVFVVDLDSPEYMTRAELREKLSAEQSAAQNLREALDRRKKEAADEVLRMIDAGYIPATLLARNLVDWHIKRDSMGPLGLGMYAVTHELKLRGHVQEYGTDGRGTLNTALAKVTERPLK